MISKSIPYIQISNDLPGDRTNFVLVRHPVYVFYHLNRVHPVLNNLSVSYVDTDIADDTGFCNKSS